MKFILVRSKNTAATEVYYDIIKLALNACGDVIFDGFEGDKLPGAKDAIVVCGTSTEMMRLWFRGYRKVITWYQGIFPEESFMRHHSYLRKMILSFVEYFALRHSKIHILVSEAMKEFHEKKYHFRMKNYYIMPCFNAVFDEQNVAIKDYDKRVFTYAGALSKWQCIEQTMDLYARIEKASNYSTKLLLLTPEKEKALEIVRRHDIVNVEIRYVHYSELPIILRDVTYGFALREDNPINRVATPTKLANYVANGVIPIYSSCVQDFLNQSNGNEYQVVIDDVNNIGDDVVEQILSRMQQPIDQSKAYSEFMRYFAEYYNPAWHAERISSLIRKVM